MDDGIRALEHNSRRLKGFKRPDFVKKNKRGSSSRREHIRRRAYRGGGLGRVRFVEQWSKKKKRQRPLKQKSTKRWRCDTPQRGGKKVVRKEEQLKGGEPQKAYHKPGEEAPKCAKREDEKTQPTKRQGGLMELRVMGLGRGSQVGPRKK